MATATMSAARLATMDVLVQRELDAQRDAAAAARESARRELTAVQQEHGEFLAAAKQELAVARENAADLRRRASEMERLAQWQLRTCERELMEAARPIEREITETERVLIQTTPDELREAIESVQTARSAIAWPRFGDTSQERESAREAAQAARRRANRLLQAEHDLEALRMLDSDSVRDAVARIMAGLSAGED